MSIHQPIHERPPQPSAQFKKNRPHIAVLGTSAGVPHEHSLRLPFDVAALLLQFREVCEKVTATGHILGNLWPQGMDCSVPESECLLRVQHLRHLTAMLFPACTFLDPQNLRTKELNPRIAPDRELAMDVIPSPAEYHAWQTQQIRRFHAHAVPVPEKSATGTILKEVSLIKVGPPFEQFFDNELPKELRIKCRYIESGYTLDGEKRPPYLALQKEQDNRILLPIDGSPEASALEAGKIRPDISKTMLDFLRRMTQAIIRKKPMEGKPRFPDSVDIGRLRKDFQEACALLRIPAAPEFNNEVEHLG
ncbi:hypothetical protein HZA87_00010 [Candidatus Uhrbacteria bacterium]|nr:hypothetical protein [Candidatus Uhrbacteria bacterium]